MTIHVLQHTTGYAGRGTRRDKIFAVTALYKLEDEDNLHSSFWMNPPPSFQMLVISGNRTDTTFSSHTRVLTHSEMIDLLETKKKVGFRSLDLTISSRRNNQILKKIEQCIMWTRLGM